MAEQMAPPAAGSPSRFSVRGVAWRSYGLPLAFLLLVLVGTIANPNFLTVSNALNILIQSSVIGIIAVGMTYVILTGGIDLSVGAVVALAGVSAALAQPFGTPVMVVVALAVGLSVGILNGALVTVGRVVPFIATLATLTVARGLALFVTNSQPIRITDQTYISIGAGRFGELLPYAVIFFVAAAVLGWFGLTHTTFGRSVYAVGGNKEAARLSGISVKRTTFAVYVISGLCAGLAAVLVSARTATGAPSAGDGYELDAIAAVIVGGTSLFGGRGSMVGTVYGVLILITIQNIFVLRNISYYAQLVMKGVIILAAVLLQRRADDEG